MAPQGSGTVLSSSTMHGLALVVLTAQRLSARRHDSRLHRLDRLRAKHGHAKVSTRTSTRAAPWATRWRAARRRPRPRARRLASCPRSRRRGRTGAPPARAAPLPEPAPRARDRAARARGASGARRPQKKSTFSEGKENGKAKTSCEWMRRPWQMGPSKRSRKCEACPIPSVNSAVS